MATPHLGNCAQFWSPSEMNPGDQDLLVSFQEQQEGIFLRNGYLDSIEGQEEVEEGVPNWSATRSGVVGKMELDELLQSRVNPNEVYNNSSSSSKKAGAAESASEADSGISDDQRPDSPLPAETTPARLFQLVYGVSVKSESSGADLVSIDLGSWNSQALLPESCVVDASRDPGTMDDLPDFPDLLLTEEEQRLLSQEGIILPSNLPLTKAEERILKKVRRKIRNKQSAQESRRRKKEYIDGLESRVAACTAQNQELQKQVEQLEHHNLSLISQLRRLQSLIKQTSNKAAQTSTCVMILVCSLMLLIFPSYSPFSLETPVNPQGYKPTGVISRTILNDLGSSQRAEHAEMVAPDAAALQEQKERQDPAANLLMPPVTGFPPVPNVVHHGVSPSLDSSDPGTAANSTSDLQPLGHGPLPKDSDSSKLGHADEM
ncbi:cyclic AMP-responsive element-binding protein 3-like protein 4 isoform X2 [Hypanus sabinus]|uniref:cyclic AMP-responsive element-binding protein 3-like protein 4 isoform X2 n=1 Tax=Hypanus sabinus TaxID=79690 RepID=UPI0028C4015A|nr:cyclic AMP-responsive element-binding protein 3-like protein 4 isoform X2 [Hypanus sabinus]